MIQSLVVAGAADKDVCNLSSPSLLQWDALSVCLESVLQRLERANGDKPAPQRCIALLKAVLDFHTRVSRVTLLYVAPLLLSDEYQSRILTILTIIMCTLMFSLCLFCFDAGPAYLFMPSVLHLGALSLPQLRTGSAGDHP